MDVKRAKNGSSVENKTNWKSHGKISNKKSKQCFNKEKRLKEQ